MPEIITTRYMPLDDVEIAKDGTGRTVRAYCAVFDINQDIVDGEGEYTEVIDRAAFNKTIADRGSFPVFFNHGATIQGAPSELYSMPLGRGVATVDGRGVMTETKYTNTPVADSVLENIREGVIKGQSFSGRAVQSALARPRGGYRRSAAGLTLVRRHEFAMTEFGPTPFPYYPGATIEGVRSLTALNTLGLLLTDGTITDSMSDAEIAAAVRARLATTSLGEPEAGTATSSEAGADQRSAAMRAAHMRARLTDRGLRHGQPLSLR